MSKKAVVKIGSDVKEAKDGINQITQQLNSLTKKANDSSFSGAGNPNGTFRR